MTRTKRNKGTTPNSKFVLGGVSGTHEPIKPRPLTIFSKQKGRTALILLATP